MKCDINDTFPRAARAIPQIPHKTKPFEHYHKIYFLHAAIHYFVSSIACMRLIHTIAEMKSRCLALSFLAISILSPSAANWPEWRGAGRSGVADEKGLPTRWNDTENIRWKLPLPDRGNSTPVVWGNRVFITQPIEAEGKRLVLCVDRISGKELWRAGTTYNLPEQSHETNPQCSASPSTDGERVIAWFGSAGVFCFDMNGKELWKRDLGKQVHNWGYGGSPLLHKDLCILHFGPGERAFMIALNKKTGETVWQVDIPQVRSMKRTDGFAGREANGMIGSFSTPIIVPANGRDELVMSFPDDLRAYDPMTGKELWRSSGLNPLIYTSPIYGDGAVVAMGGFMGSAIAVKPGGAGDVTETHRLWQVERTKNRLGSGVIKDGHIFVLNSNGVAECLDLKTGKTIWEERIDAPGAKDDSWSCMVLAGDLIYVLTQSADTVILKASPKFEIVAANAIGNELTNSSLAVSDGDIFIRTHKHLWCVSSTRKTASVR